MTAEAPRIALEFCGEVFSIVAPGDFSVGREADLSLDDNPYLHRQFLRVFFEHGMWWLANVGTLLTATVTDGTGGVQAWLAPGARLPIVFEVMHVMFSAGPTTYDFTIQNPDDIYSTSRIMQDAGGSTTVLPVTLTTSQRQLIVALAEAILTQQIPGRASVPSSADAAARLGWSLTTFNRKLDNVCDKLDKVGVPGLRGGAGKLATGRRNRLVEYAVATHLVSVEDLALLELPSRA